LREGSVQMTGTTFAMSWCVSLRRCAVAGHDFRKTLTQIIKTRAKASLSCAKAVHPDQRISPDRLQLGAPAICVNCFGAFLAFRSANPWKICKVL
jgi:hypothetical protein